MKSTTADGSPHDDGKVVEINGPTWRGEVWKADGLTHVRLPNGRVKAFGPKAVYSVDFGKPRPAAVR